MRQTIEEKEINKKITNRCGMPNCENYADYFIPSNNGIAPHYYCRKCRDSFPGFTHVNFISFYALEWLVMAYEEFNYA